ncbi:MAG TPA: hypothetical protein VFN85_11615 [Solirubrobacterales bacterium]|nr:hypothetical protein [Solirubrobacterales bacterium]
MVLGCAVSAIGFYLWGHSLTHLSVSEQWCYAAAMVVALAGMPAGKAEEGVRDLVEAKLRSSVEALASA